MDKGPYIEQATEYFSSIWTPEEVEAMKINNLSHTKMEAEINVIRLKKKQQTMIKSIEDLMDDITSGEYTHLITCEPEEMPYSINLAETLKSQMGLNTEEGSSTDIILSLIHISEPTRPY